MIYYVKNEPAVFYLCACPQLTQVCPTFMQHTLIIQYDPRNINDNYESIHDMKTYFFRKTRKMQEKRKIVQVILQLSSLLFVLCQHPSLWLFLVQHLNFDIQYCLRSLPPLTLCCLPPPLIHIFQCCDWCYSNRLLNLLCVMTFNTSDLILSKLASSISNLESSNKSFISVIQTFMAIQLSSITIWQLVNTFFLFNISTRLFW